MSGHEVLISLDGPGYTPVCRTCGWSGQDWATDVGAEREGEFHREHPDLSGEHPTIEEDG